MKAGSPRIFQTSANLLRRFPWLTNFLRKFPRPGRPTNVLHFVQIVVGGNQYTIGFFRPDIIDINWWLDKGAGIGIKFSVSLIRVGPPSSSIQPQMKRRARHYPFHTGGP